MVTPRPKRVLDSSALTTVCTLRVFLAPTLCVTSTRANEASERPGVLMDGSGGDLCSALGWAHARRHA